MNKASENKIIDSICGIFNSIDLCIEGDNYKILAVRVKKSKRGITYMLCFTFFTSNGYIYKNKGVPAMPLVLFEHIRECRVVGYIRSINALPFELWFKGPLTKKKMASLNGILDKAVV